MLLAASLFPAIAADPAWRDSMLKGLQAQRTGGYTQAESLLKKAVQLSQGDDAATSRSLTALASVEQDLGRPATAEGLYRRAIAADASFAEPVNDLASLYFDERQFGKAEALMARCVEQPATPLEKARRMGNLAVLYQAERKMSQAEESYTESMNLFEAAGGGATPEMAFVLFNLSSLRMDQGRADDARPYAQRAVAIWAATLGVTHPTYAEGLAQLAHLDAASGRRPEAERLWIRALSILETRLGSGHPTYIRVLRGYADYLQRSGQKTEAKRVRRELASIEAAHPAPRGYVVDYRDLMRR